MVSFGKISAGWYDKAKEGLELIVYVSFRRKCFSLEDIDECFEATIFGGAPENISSFIATGITPTEAINNLVEELKKLGYHGKMDITYGPMVEEGIDILKKRKQQHPPPAP